ncbi:peptidoglycan-binding domain-containing protein [Streptomyces cavernae]|uniref:peptidoglycan-binding domain-containing protein n=1 Tax=Streptomyces cavernae TaxID=2259034 RepID=UPI000FEB91E0|nr:peptidoglycan-binding domain-containing protein [Streptomyces cavernae]
MKSVRLLQSLGCTVALAAGLVVVPATTASAVPHCSKEVYRSGIFLPAASNNALDCNMGRGSNSNAVRALQFNLNMCYNAGLAQDGDFGGATERALKAAQRKEKVAADGVYGPNTRRAMTWLRDSAGCVDDFFS